MQITYVGVPPTQRTMVQIYYWEHDQSEERPLEEFFRGESSSLVQWQAQPMTSFPVAGTPMQVCPSSSVVHSGAGVLRQSSKWFGYAVLRTRIWLISCQT